MRELTLQEVLALHRTAIEHAGGSAGIREIAGVQSAVMQPFLTFGGQELYPTMADKAAAICFSIVMNHPFVDGNKRVGHAAMESFLNLNGLEIQAPIDEQEQTILNLAAGALPRDAFVTWVRNHVAPLDRANLD
jgi:death-on-curing protein